MNHFNFKFSIFVDILQVLNLNFKVKEFGNFELSPCLSMQNTAVAYFVFLWLFILVQPEIDKSKELRKAASKTGVTGYLTCRAEGAPLVQFEWRKVNRIDKTK